MTRNETVFTDENGVSQLIKYTELLEVDGTLVAIDWDIETDEITERVPTQQEVDQVESKNQEDAKSEALETIELAKNSENEEISSLANAFSKLIQ